MISEALRMSRERRALVTTVPRAIPGRQLLMAHESSAARCESIRALRTELMLRRGSTNAPEVLALLSPSAGEGRSLLAAELAIAFAQTGRPTLLIDADLRRPHQHVLFGTANLRGLSQAIETGLAPNLYTVEGVPLLSLLTAGMASTSPLELVSGRSFAMVLQALRQRFHFVVIDTPPVMQYPDGLAIASQAGAVLALSRAQHTPYKGMQDMLRRLDSMRAKVLGAVISHF